MNEEQLTKVAEKLEAQLEASAELVLRIANKATVHKEAAIDLAEKVQFLLNAYQLGDEDGVFTFPDGDSWNVEKHAEPINESTKIFLGNNDE